jgi:hypothetical protein
VVGAGLQNPLTWKIFVLLNRGSLTVGLSGLDGKRWFADPSSIRRTDALPALEREGN